jgi:hypothetical protein
VHSIRPQTIFFHHNVCYEDKEIHCVEIAVLRKLQDFELISNYLSFVYATITILGIKITLSMALLDRTYGLKNPME